MTQKVDTQISEFNYSLPENRIAKFPLSNRDESKLLEFNNNSIQDYSFKDLPQLLPTDSILLFNNTKVIHARIEFFKATGARIEVFCLEPHTPFEYQQNLSTTKNCTWHCIVGNSKKWKQEELTLEFNINSKKETIKASRKEVLEQGSIVEFTWSGNYSFGEVLEAIGQIPIPPYLQRNSEEIDSERYQTTYAKHNGSVAAPTAGLHFTPEIISRLHEKNISSNYVTLHVGAGTFKPVSTDSYKEHSMHREFFTVEKSLIKKLANNTSPVIAVGTTSVRTIESLYWLGVKLISKQENTINELFQWEAYELIQTISVQDAFKALLNELEKTNSKSFQAYTQIMIIPGYTFKVVDKIITNFHQPQSTLLLLVCAFIGKSWKEMYEHALNNNYRFLSYGDSSLLHKKHSK